MEQTPQPTTSVSENYHLLTQEERRNIIIKQLLARYPPPETDRAFPRNPTIPPSSISSSDSQSQDTPDDRIGNVQWCICQGCIKMPTQVESVCCQEIEEVKACIPDGKKCITESDMFCSQIATEQTVRLMSTMLHLESLPVVDSDNNR
ncbi:hypothetical protein AB205_0183680 [Aquarana catesbeiana]|uniref:Uncharacterized protein n=1 Tax=Aquarana catesbeiana TaxID=8400 RepID=A0A2G9Q812_AQUCT|nr:hypothetical protein AB205_0183680 [Aquarana catesbeiana]